MPLIAPHHRRPHSQARSQAAIPDSDLSEQAQAQEQNTTTTNTSNTNPTTVDNEPITAGSETGEKMSKPDRPKTLNFITSNAGKLRETRAVLFSTGSSTDKKEIDIELQSRGDVEIDEIQGSIEDIARDKCRRAAVAVGGPVLTEDTALEFQALKGLPGPYIKYFLAALGHDGLNNLLAAYEDKTAFAVCTFAFCAGPGEEVILFQAKTKGKIVPARGPGNFGWDPCFEYNGKTYAEMEKDEKNAISHRGKALQKLKLWLAGGEPEP